MGIGLLITGGLAILGNLQEAEHQKLLEAFSQKVKDYQAGSEGVDSLLQFLMDWFVSHTSLEDRKIGDHLSQKK